MAIRTSPKRTRTKTPISPPTQPASPRTAPHAAFLDSNDVDAHEHGEHAAEAPRVDELIGTSGSHTPAPDQRAEEPFGELAASASNEGGTNA